MLQELENIIIRMPNWLGDAVMATPIIADVRHQWPNATITAMLLGHDPGRLGQRGHAQVLAGQHRLGLDQLLVEPVQRQPGRQHRVLHVEQAVVEAGQQAGIR